MLQLRVICTLATHRSCGICSYHALISRHYHSTNAVLPARPPRSVSLAGTVPHHSSYLLIYARDPPSTWPPVFTTPLYKDLHKRMKEIDGLVNFCWLGKPPNAALREDQSQEAYNATLWKKSDSQVISFRVDIPFLSTKNVALVMEQVLRRDRDMESEETAASSGPYFYICTHGKRDCRCGIRGSELFQALQKELDWRGMLFDQTGRPRVCEVAHVSGHKNAPNLLVFPFGDWYGNVDSTDLTGLIDHYVSRLEERPIPPSLLDGPNRFQWRGRMGMTRKEQGDAFHGHEWGATDLLGFSGLLQ
ncbi:hypothetical protein K439DRAFT_1630500 [Ramaria rubella]|nr:hypothetical protein K439DRAFT_1630500 [Ramaria rubella]